MYMRRWAGPGSPYPMSAKTTGSDIIPEDKISAELMNGTAIMEKMSNEEKNIFNLIHVCQYSNGSLQRSNDSLHKWWNDVVNEKQCIRIASAYFIGTAYHYLMIIYHELIPSFDISSLERIS